MAASRSDARRAAAAAGRTSARRRQRSVRVTVAVVLLAVATIAVLLALPTQSAPVLSAAAVTAIVLGWSSVRIVWTEVLQSRREHAADRASAAHAYRSLFTERAAEHAEFTTAMTERLAESNLSLRELEGALIASQREIAAERVRADRAVQRVAELESSIEVLRAERDAEQAAAIAVWEAEGGEPAPGSLDDLVAFDEKVAQAAGRHAAEESKLA